MLVNSAVRQSFKENNRRAASKIETYIATQLLTNRFFRVGLFNL